MFEAINAARYERQEAIRRIDGDTGKQLICYVSGRHTHIHRDDVIFFADLLERIQHGSNIDLLLHTPGGDMDVAEKIVSMIRARSGEASFRVIVPDFAKSAGTLIAIGGDVALMSDTSELGPIDPQISVNDSQGNRVSHSVQALPLSRMIHVALCVTFPAPSRRSALRWSLVPLLRRGIAVASALCGLAL
jgi:hypothetical protein